MKVRRFKLSRRRSVDPFAPQAAPAPAEAPPPARSRGRRAKPKLPKLPSGYRIAVASLRDFGASWKRLAWIVGLVAVPGNLLALNSDLAQSQLYTATSSFFAFIMNVALLWAVARRQQTGRMPTVAEAYYDGQVALVRYLLVTVALVCMLIPFALGLVLYAAGQIVPGADVGAFSPELMLLAVVWLVLTIPSFFFVVRFALGTIAAVADGFRPVAALRVSWRITNGRFWATAGRLASLALLLIVLSIPLTVLSAALGLLHAGAFATAFFEIVTTMVALPITDIYMLRLYRELEGAALNRRPDDLAENAASLQTERDESLAGPSTE